MRHSLMYLIIIITFPAFCFGQANTSLDARDNKSFETGIINGTTWMLNNLDFVTELSFGLTEDQKEKYELEGRYYHLSEIDSVCPVGWKLPDPDDWLGYFEYLSNNQTPAVTLEFTGESNHFAFSGYSDKIDLFAKDSPLNLAPTGRFEGTVFNLPNVYADYWTLDPPTYQTVSDKAHGGTNHVHIMPVVARGKTHIHMRVDSFTNIHSHDHHLKPKQEKKLRRFMVRCVKTKD